jgi:hypothetical protein
MCLLASAAPATAQMALPPLSDAEVTSIVEAVRPSLPQARLGDGSQVPRETAAELAQPILSTPASRLVIRRGLASGLLAGCGQDSDARSFLPMMKAIRETGRFSDKQLAFVGLLHGAMQGLSAAQVSPANCTPALLSALDHEISQPLQIP